MGSLRWSDGGQGRGHLRRFAVLLAVVSSGCSFDDRRIVPPATTADAAIDAALDVGQADAIEAPPDATVDVPSDRDASPVDRVDVIGLPDVQAGRDVPDAGAPDAGTADAGPPTMTISFVGGAFSGQNASGSVRMRATISWHGALRGTSDGGRIRFEGWVH